MQYRRLIAWGPRIEREAPFLREHLADAPSRRVIDLGCGTGEHVAHLHAEGWDAVGIDRSEDQIAAARDHVGPQGRPRFLHGEMADLAELDPEPFGAALCVGNVLPSLEDAELAITLAALAARLLAGAPLIVQLLNYEPLLSGAKRHLPLNFRPDPNGTEDDEIVWIRLVRPFDSTHVDFFPLTVRLRPGHEESPVTLERAQRRRMRAWRRPELTDRLAAAGFARLQVFGSMTGDDFDPERSSDLVLVGRRMA